MKLFKLLLTPLVLFWLALGLSTCSEPEKPKPEITSVSPVEGPIGTPITITGKNLASSESVSFGSVKSLIASSTNTKIETVVPPGLSPGSLSLSVKTDEATSNSVSFLVVPGEPEITTIVPARASVGMEVILQGKNLNTASSVKFGTKTITTFISKSDTEIKMAVPAGLGLGALDVTVTTEIGTSEKSTFTVVGKPTISSLTPAIGPVGRVVLIAGTFFEETSKVKFGAGEATFLIKNATLIEATVPTTATTGKVTVTTPGGDAVSLTDFVVKDAPKITSFSPATGIVGTVVTINGESFDAGALVVKFGTGTASSPTLVSPTKITATVPAAATTGKITVETAAGSVQSSTDFTVIGSPAVTAFSPTSGAIGAEVIITGTNFFDVSNVKFNTTTVTSPNFTVASSTQIKVNVPAGAATGKISVTTLAGSGASANNFTVLVPPAITSFSPASGAQGSSVVITGTGFSGITAVSFNNVNATTFSATSSTQITVTVPPSATSGTIKVTNTLGTATSVNTFYVTPFISTITPTSGTSGSTITLTGTNLATAKVRFNSTEVTPVTNTSTSITAVVPAIASGAVNVTVVNQGGTSNSKTFTITSPVVLDEIVAPANITEQLILMKGSNLPGATKVLFGTVEASVLTNTSTVVTAIIPASLAVGNYSVKVVTSNGTSNGKNFERLSVQNPNTGDVSMVNGAIVVAPPGGYVPPVSNQWTNTFDPNQKFFLEETNFGAATGPFTVEFSENFNLVATGSGIYDKPNNYIEFTLQGIRYVGIWTPRNAFNDGFDDYCVYHMTLISAQSGKQLELAVNVFGTCN
jgi:large repetitive protein